MIQFQFPIFWNFLSYIPIVLFFFSLSLFYQQKKTYTTLFYIIGLLSNICINILLKLWFRQPRPNKTIYSTIASFHNYGMPSGHSQFAIYSLVYLHLTQVLNRNDHLYTFFTYIFLTLLILFQRIYINVHTFAQVLVGALVGALVGTITYLCLKENRKRYFSYSYS